MSTFCTIRKIKTAVYQKIVDSSRKIFIKNSIIKCAIIKKRIVQLVDPNQTNNNIVLD